MCGIAGIWFGDSRCEVELTDLTRRMANALAHRGPDDDGCWTEAASGVGLGFRRLAILDTSPLGHQPMVSHSGRYVIVFNGEIYNFKELRAELEVCGHLFRGGSDTEVLLAAVAEWGLLPAVRRLNGMFALALWDRQERTLSLARDAMGIKPLYYGWQRNSLFFGSELKALRACPNFEAKVNPLAIQHFLRLGYVPAPHSIYQEVYKLQPGCLVTFRSPSERAERVPFWSLKTVAESGKSELYSGSDAEAAAELRRLLQGAVRREMVADVPLGAFLSGGIDSSLVVALMQEASPQRVKTFTIEFDEAGYNEGPHALRVAHHLETDHQAFRVTAREAMEVIPRLSEIYDEPFADTSQIPTCILSQMTRRKVVVSLSGDGGDEMFGGYTHYTNVAKMWNRFAGVPLSWRRSLSQGVRFSERCLRPLLPQSLNKFSGTLRARAQCLAAMSEDEYYASYSSRWWPMDIPVKSERIINPSHESPRPVRLDNFVERMMYADQMTGLPDQMLVKVDRASSAYGLEVRVPLLDQNLVEFSWRLSLAQKQRDGIGKRLLRQVLHGYVPATLVERPKQGFSVPVAQWIRGPLRDWAEELLDAKRLNSEGYFNPQPIRECWKEHLNGRMNHERELWPVLMFQAWMVRWT